MCANRKKCAYFAAVIVAAKNYLCEPVIGAMKSLLRLYKNKGLKRAEVSSFTGLNIQVTNYIKDYLDKQFGGVHLMRVDVVVKRPVSWPFPDGVKNREKLPLWLFREAFAEVSFDDLTGKVYTEYPKIVCCLQFRGEKGAHFWIPEYFEIHYEGLGIEGCAVMLNGNWRHMHDSRVW